MELRQQSRAIPTWALLLAVYFVSLTVLLWPVVVSMVSIWMRSDTFAHGFLIFPISMWLVWRDRDALSSLPWDPVPSMSIVCMALAAVVWLGTVANILVLQQLAYVAALIAGTWAVLGHALAQRLAFPLGFLFLAVPMGLSLEPPMMDLTAEWTVRMIRWTGIPVYQEGRFFQLPTGSWSVVEACSGVRYLIASFTLGVLYAYLSYRALWRRLLFVLLSILVPVVANVLRAYGIVMLGHLSDMRLATGVDHLIYGWLFFGVVMLLLFIFGNLWLDPDPEEDQGIPLRGAGSPHSVFPGSAVPVTLLCLACAALAPGLGYLHQTYSNAVAGPLVFQAEAGWQAAQSAPGAWRPPLRGAQQVVDLALKHREGSAVQLHVRRFIEQAQGGAELVSYGDQWLRESSDWRVLAQRWAAPEALKGQPVREVELHEPGGRRLLSWTWYEIGGRRTADDLAAKLLELRQGLLFKPRAGSQVFLATSFDSNNALPLARERLEAFLRDNSHALTAAITVAD